MLGQPMVIIMTMMLLAEQERALLKAEEAKAPVDRRNPWGGVAERWTFASS